MEDDYGARIHFLFVFLSRASFLNEGDLHQSETCFSRCFSRLEISTEDAVYTETKNHHVPLVPSVRPSDSITFYIQEQNTLSMDAGRLLKPRQGTFWRDDYNVDLKNRKTIGFTSNCNVIVSYYWDTTAFLIPLFWRIPEEWCLVNMNILTLPINFRAINKSIIF